MEKRIHQSVIQSLSKFCIPVLLITVFGLTHCTVIPIFNKKEKDSKAKLALAFLIVDSMMCHNSRGEFWARDTVTNVSYCVKTDFVTESNNAKLYVEKNLSTGLNYSSILSTYENQIINRETQAFGAPSDIDNDGKITVIVLDIIDGSTSSSGFVAGFFDPVNFYTDDPSKSLRSNQKEILYMDGKELAALEGRSPGSFLITLAHELQHLIRFQYELATNTEDDTWINEGTSEVASDITGFGPQASRISCFRGTSCSGGVSGISIANWSSELKSYAYAYSLMKYIYENSGTTTAQKYAFFKKSVSGDTSGVRANNATNLMEVFKSASSYNASILNPYSSNSDMFKRLMAAFWGQSQGYANITTTYFGNTSIVSSIDSVRTNYPLPSELAGLYAFGGLSYSGTGPVNTSISPTATYRLNGNTTGVTSGGSNFVVVKNSINDYLLLNGAVSGTSSQSGTAILLEPIDYPKLDLKEEVLPICPNKHLHTVHAIHKRTADLTIYQKQSEETEIISPENY
ncbi:MAG: hypothetical protein L6Q54_13030 [Leptospiraceae bacterium]|nr:hypothetical protein [Leptospiraceae bacterium]MCK6382157.1 hypothetical protein [Leptospiraceae bacterium]NUM41499.1 hypothetical protein [Leptospiraceae bacterium]